MIKVLGTEGVNMATANVVHVVEYIIPMGGVHHVLGKLPIKLDIERADTEYLQQIENFFAAIAEYEERHQPGVFRGRASDLVKARHWLSDFQIGAIN